MKISLKVLSHFIDDKNSLELLRKESKNLIEKLPFLGLEIGGVQQQGEGLDKVVIGRFSNLKNTLKLTNLTFAKSTQVDQSRSKLFAEHRMFEKA